MRQSETDAGLLIEVIFAHKKKENIPPNKEECPGCPDMYQSLVRQCYSENPKKRPTSYGKIGGVVISAWTW